MSDPQSQPRPAPSNYYLEISEAEKADFHRPSEENSQQQRPEEPRTIGRHRLQIEEHKGELGSNLLVWEKIEGLSQRYSAWRRSRGDENCFYRCLGVLLLEHLCRPDSPLQELGTFLTEIVSQNRHFVLSSLALQKLGAIKLYARLLQDLYNKRTRGENALQHLQYCLQLQNVDKAMIVAMRNYTASYLQMNSQHPDFAPFNESLPAFLSEVNTYGRDVEGIALPAAARCFSVVLHIFAVDIRLSSMTEAVFGPENPGSYPSFSLLHHNGHYSCLIRRDAYEADHYDFAANTYAPIPTGQLVGYERFEPPPRENSAQ